MEQPVLETVRLLLRPFVLGDAPDVRRLAGASEVADTTLNLPHPYTVSDAEQWIGSQLDGDFGAAPPGRARLLARRPVLEPGPHDRSRRSTR